jgi:acetyl-CoA carboxylase carboxyltransferase component
MPKETERDRIIKLEQNMKNIENTINRIETKLDTFIESENKNRKAFEDKFDEKCRGFDDRYASKRIEAIVDKGMWIIISSVLLAILGLVLIKGGM